jgi:hypothetical protein
MSKIDGGNMLNKIIIIYDINFSNSPLQLIKEVQGKKFFLEFEPEKATLYPNHSKVLKKRKKE